MAARGIAIGLILAVPFWVLAFLIGRALGG